jgi:glycosyltransferase involved in cell wall biosynthesis/lauroyl/myristoyl acyltransferase
MSEMSAIVDETAEVPHVTPEELGATSAFAGLVDSPRHPSPGFARKYLLSAVIWVLYVPHHAILRLLGPRYGMVWARVAANAHWLLTFVGAQRRTRRSMEKMHPALDSNLSVSQLLRRHLELKHECFARVRVYNLHGPSTPRNDIHWQTNSSCISAKPKMEGRERGLIIVGYHFGFFQLVTTALSQLDPACNPVQLRYRFARCAEQAMSPIARLVMRRAVEADHRSGAPIFYIDEDTSLRQLFRLLRKAGCLALAADGMLADDFVEVPFFDGTLRVPTGWARLAAATSSDILLLYDTQIDPHHRDAWFFNHVDCSTRTAESVERAVAEAIHALELAIRRQPWAWHPWQRLRWEYAADGSPRYYLRPFGADTGDAANQLASSNSQVAGNDMDVPKNQPSIGQKELGHSPRGIIPAVSTRSANRFTASHQHGAHERPRVAIVCNSLTPYRIQLHERIVAEVPELELWSVSTHANAYDRWAGCEPPASIRPIAFGHGEPTNEQAQMRYSVREWRKAGRFIDWLTEHDVSAVFCQGCGDMGRLRILHHCYRRGIPCFLYGDFNICGDRVVGPKRWLKRAVYSHAVKWASGLMPCGLRGEELLARYGGANKPQFLFPFVPDVGMFEDPSPETVEEIRGRFELRPARRRIVFSARLMRAKRPDLAIQAFAKIASERPDWDLLVLGDGDLRSSLEGQVPSDLRNRVLWTGFLHDVRDVAALYALCDVLLLPSDHEPWGVVIAEAAAAGMAIVASDATGAAPELVQDYRNGFQFSTGNLASLVQTLRQCTSPDWIDGGKQQSRAVLREWLAEADPVAGFRAALGECGLLSHKDLPLRTDRQSETSGAHKSALVPK